MSDVTVLLLTFFMLTSTFVKKEPVQVNTPASVSEIKIPEKNILSILVDPKGRVFMGLDKKDDMAAVLESMGQEYGVQFTPKRSQRFQYHDNIRCTYQGYETILNIANNRREFQEAYMGSAANEGIPTDSLDNQFKAWQCLARDQNPDLRIAIKADAKTPYSVVKKVMNSLQDLKENRYNLITTLKTVSDEKKVISYGKRKRKDQTKENELPCRLYADGRYEHVVDHFLYALYFFSKPQTMEISMPSNDKNVNDQDRSKVKESQAITILLGDNDRVFYFTGLPANAKKTMQESTYKADGIRKCSQKSIILMQCRRL